MKRLLLFVLSLCFLPMLSAGEQSFYIGTYTGGDSKGIYQAQIDLETGALSGGELVAEAENPSWLHVSKDGKFLYACNETKTGEVSAFAVESDKLRFLNKVASGGAHPCHLDISPDGKTVVVANYSGGNLASFEVLPDGQLTDMMSLSQHKGSSTHKRQAAPHAHEALFANGRLYCCDLGMDEVLEYTVTDSKLRMHTSDYKVPAGGGPRHLGVHPNHTDLYVLNEISSSITYFNVAGRQGTVSTLPTDWKGTHNSTAEITVHPNGKFVYASNRGDDSIAMFSIGATGSLTAIGHVKTGGKTPRNFELTPDARFLIAANQNSGDLFSFRVDATTGKLTATGHSLKIPKPVCIAFAP